MGLFEEIKARQGIEPPPAEPPPDPAPGPPEQVEPADADGITRRFMDSKVLGAVVPIAWTERGDKVWVDGVCYLEREIQELMARRPDAETMRTVHQVKKTFDGTLH